MATKSYLCLTPVYFAIFRSEASSAAAPLTQDVFGKCDCARVSGMVTSQVMDLPHCHGMSVHPSTRLSVPSRVKPFGSFCDGTCALMSALCMMSLIASCLGSLPAPRRHESPWLPLRSTLVPHGQSCSSQRSTPMRRPTATRTASSSSLRPHAEMGHACSQCPPWGLRVTNKRALW